MARQEGTATDSLDLYTTLAGEPWSFDFFQAMRRIECGHADRPRWGQSLHVGEEPVRLGQEPTLAFAPSTLASFKPPSGDQSGRLQVFFLGLFGPNGPMPLHFTEYVRDRMRNHGDFAFARFADLFHHRMLSLFYRAWAEARPAVQCDRPETDAFARRLGSLFGMGSRTLHPGEPLDARALLYHAGILAAASRSAEGLAGLLTSFFGIPARVESFVGHWIELPAGASCRLGGSPECAALGSTATVGTRVWDCQHKFRVALGPMGLQDYRRFLPGNESLRRLAALVHTYVGHELWWDVRLALVRLEVPALELGREARLGWTSWLHSRPAEHDAADLVLDPMARPGNAVAPASAAGNGSGHGTEVVNASHGEFAHGGSKHG